MTIAPPTFFMLEALGLCLRGRAMTMSTFHQPGQHRSGTWCLHLAAAVLLLLVVPCSSARRNHRLQTPPYKKASQVCNNPISCETDLSTGPSTGHCPVAPRERASRPGHGGVARTRRSRLCSRLPRWADRNLKNFVQRRIRSESCTRRLAGQLIDLNVRLQQ